MAKKLVYNFWRLGLTTGLLFVLTTVSYAQVVTAPSPDILVKLAEKNALLAAVYIMAAVTCAVMLFAWKMFMSKQEDQRVSSETAKAMQATAAAVNRLVDELNTRPCIKLPPQPKNPNLLETIP